MAAALRKLPQLGLRSATVVHLHAEHPKTIRKNRDVASSWKRMGLSTPGGAVVGIMTIIFPVLCQELLSTEQSFMATDGNGWQLHSLGSRTLCASSPSPGPRSARLPPSTCARPRAPVPGATEGPKWKPRNARSHAWRLVSRSKLLASWLSPKFWTPECQRLSACRVGSQTRFMFLNGLRFCLAGAQSTEEAAALAALLQYPGPEEATVNQSPCAAQPPWPLCSQEHSGLCCPRHGLRRPDPCGPCVLILQVFRSTNLLQTGML